jgi:hypothetical protein
VRNRLDAEVDHEVNVRAELAIRQFDECLRIIERRLVEVSSLLSCTPAFCAGMKTSTTGVIFDLK